MNVLNRFLIGFFSLFISSTLYSQEVSGPDGKLKLNVEIENGAPIYSVTYNGKSILEKSPLGLLTNEGDFSSNMRLLESNNGETSKEYSQDKIKQSVVSYKANTLKCILANEAGRQISILFQVSNNDIAFRYELPKWG
ncbi:MAG TPA: glycoside hydrolase family 97 N-terminal domain-containing protein, partial [Thermoclostridium sp.]|nr:glycoside hydrolase family 97 N-terminal domain-containing protein [Thermoclostridium sp.]